MDLPLEIDAPTAAQALQEGALLLDVREPDELAICQIEGCRHIPMGQITGKLGELPRDRPLLVLCHQGVRSLMVTRFLRANGFAQTSNVAGGIDAWAELVDPTLARY